MQQEISTSEWAQLSKEKFQIPKNEILNPEQMKFQILKKGEVPETAVKC